MIVYNLHSPASWLMMETVIDPDTWKTSVSRVWYEPIEDEL